MHCFGTGHSRIPVEELFPRYGSYPGFAPLVELSMTFHTQVVGANGQRQAMAIERMEGFAQTILANFRLRPTDAAIVFSAGGTTAVPIEMAMGFARARPEGDRGHVGRALARRAPQHSSGTRLLDHADVVLDLCTPPGDALVEVDGARVGPGSSVAAVALANAVKVRTAELLAERGALPPVLAAARSSAPTSRRGSSTRPTPSTRTATPPCCAPTEVSGAAVAGRLEDSSDWRETP